MDGLDVSGAREVSEMTAAFAGLARELASRSTLEATLQAIVARSAEVIPGAQEAAITTRRVGQNYRTIAATSDFPRRVDAVQYLTDEGPCVDSIRFREVHRTDDVAGDERWPRFGPAAHAQTGVVSMLSQQLFLEDDNVLGALNLYSTAKAAFSETDAFLLELFATHCAIALARAQARDEVVNLRAALESNRRIGAAVGILMSVHKITDEEAFDLIRLASQHTHRKLRDVAEGIVETGTLEL